MYGSNDKNLIPYHIVLDTNLNEANSCCHHIRTVHAMPFMFILLRKDKFQVRLIISCYTLFCIYCTFNQYLFRFVIRKSAPLSKKKFSSVS